MEKEGISKQKIVIDYFIEHPTATINEISDATGISKSSCQRYLNIPEFMNIRIPSTGNTVAEQLMANKVAGNQKGGRTTFLTHTVQKDAAGKFVGTTRDVNDENKEEHKREDIIRIVRYFSQNPYVTLDGIVEYFDKIYTRSYIYACLNDPRVEELFGKLIASAVKQQLDSNRYGIRRKFGDKWGQELFKEAGLSEREVTILNLRFSEDIIRSAEDVAYELGITRQMVLKIEDRAFYKLEEYQRNVKEK